MLDADKVKAIKFKDYEVEDEASLTFAKQGKRICVCFDGWQQDYGASYAAFGEDTMEALAELGLALREELYAGETDALQVMHDYCAADEVSGGNSEVGHQLASILAAY